MPTFTLEEGESDAGKCDCCGKITKTIWGYISRKGLCCAVYYVSWTEGHRERGATFLISLGDWENEEATDRQSFALRLKMMPTGAAFMMVDAAKTQWARNEAPLSEMSLSDATQNDAEENASEEKETARGELLGVMLSRESALVSPLKADVFAIADLILDRDKRFKPFLKPPALPDFMKPRSVMKPPRNMKWN